MVAALLTLLLAIMVQPHRIKREADDAKAEKERLAKELAKGQTGMPRSPSIDL